jgi:hypothetical protein
MKELIKRLCNLLCIKSIVTLTLTGVFSYLSVSGLITPTEFVILFTVVINYYFETQRNKKSEDTENKGA